MPASKLTVKNAPNLEPEKPAILVAPVLKKADGSSDVRIADLPANTCLIPWHEFIVAAMKRYPGWGVGIVLACLLTVGIVYLSGPLIPENVRPGITVSAPLIIIFLLGKVIDRSCTRLFCVVRIDGHGETFIDYQRPWRDEAVRWPDAYKITMGRDRVLWLDARDPEHVRPFWPWGHPMPRSVEVEGVTVPGITTAKVGGINTTRREVTKLHSWRETDSREMMTQVFLLLVLGGSLLAMWLAGDKAINLFVKGTP